MLLNRLRIGLWFALLAFSATAGAAEPARDVRTAIMSLPRDEKDRLRNSQDRFERLPESERKKFQELHQSIESHPRRDELLGVLDRYYTWVRTLRPSELEELRKLQAEDPAEWLAKVGEFRRRERLNGVSPLFRDDYEQLRAWWDEIAARHFKRRKVRDGEFRGDRGPPPGDRASEQRGAPPGPWMIFEDADDGDFERLKSQLSDEAATVLGEQTSKREKVELVIRWFFQRFKPLDRAELERFFANELNPVEREQLLRLNRADMEEQLKQRYNFAHGNDFPERGPPFPPGRPPGSPGEGDGPRK